MAASTKIILVLKENETGKLVQSENTKTYKTFAGVITNYLGFGAYDPEVTIINDNYQTVQSVRNGIYHLVDISNAIPTVIKKFTS
jgi:hypothetical protein